MKGLIDRLNRRANTIKARNNKLEDNSEKIIRNIHQREREGKHENELKKHREGGKMRKSKST